MTERDPVLSRLAALEPSQPAAGLTAKIRAAARQRLTPRPLHPLFTVAVVGSVLSYLLWATYFASHLY